MKYLLFLIAMPKRVFCSLILLKLFNIISKFLNYIWNMSMLIFCLEHNKVESLTIDILLTKKFEIFLIIRLSIYF
jgi:hypothetical protein